MGSICCQLVIPNFDMYPLPLLGKGESLLRYGEFIIFTVIDAVNAVQELLHINVEWQTETFLMM